MSEHTKLPWKVAELREPAGVAWDIIIRNSEGHPVASVNVAGWPKKQAKEHAEFIVRACNAHDALVESLAGLYSDIANDAMNTARAALALARGEKVTP